MKNLYPKLGVALACVVVIATVVFYLTTKHSESTITSNPCVLLGTTTDCMNTAQWKTFHNTALGYSIGYPTEMGLSSENDYATDFTKEPDLEFGGNPFVRVEIWSYASTTGVETLKLKEFANAVRDAQLNNPDPYVKDKIVGEMHEITFAGKDAYAFSLTQAFTTVGGGGYLLSGEFTYIIVQNSEGQKMIVSYWDTNPIATKMIQTFSFD